MGSYLISQQFVRVAAVVFVTLAAAIAVIQSRRGEDPTIIAPLGPREADVLVGDLARCRTITSDDTAALDACRRAWAENRQRFFTTKLPQLPAAPAPNTPGVIMKNQHPPHEVEQGRAR